MELKTETLPRRGNITEIKMSISFFCPSGQRG